MRPGATHALGAWENTETSWKPGAVLRSRLQQCTRGSIILTFGGGVNEMQRDLISQFTLGLPRADR